MNDARLDRRPAAARPDSPERRVGARTPLIDGIEKVTGRARYTADLPFGPTLVGRVGPVYAGSEIAPWLEVREL